MDKNLFETFETKMEEDLAIKRWCNNQAHRNKVTRGLAANSISRTPMHVLFAIAALVGVLLIVTQ